MKSDYSMIQNRHLNLKSNNFLNKINIKIKIRYIFVRHFKNFAYNNLKISVLHKTQFLFFILLCTETRKKIVFQNFYVNFSVLRVIHNTVAFINKIVQHLFLITE